MTNKEKKKPSFWRAMRIAFMYAVCPILIPPVVAHNFAEYAKKRSKERKMYKKLFILSIYKYHAKEQLTGKLDGPNFDPELLSKLVEASANYDKQIKV